jgi:TolB-like protein/Tfp pilus assembly protein PilF
MGAILHEEPEPLTTHLPSSSQLLQDTVNQLLAKNPDERIQTIEEVTNRLTGLSSRADELRLAAFLRSRLGKRLTLALTLVIAVSLIGWWALQMEPTPVGGPIVSSIAVLPLENLSGDPEQDYFVDGMTEALITDLSKIGALKVIARSSAMRYKDTEKPLSEIAEELDVEAVIEGSVLREADQVRINAELIEVATGQNLWADRYERDLTSILALQGEVAQAIASEIRVTLSPEEQTLLTRTRQVNPEAYEDYLKGQFHYAKLTKADLETALQYYELALEKDPDSALAYAGIALAWAGAQQFNWVQPQEAGPKAKTAAEKAIELNDTVAEAHNALAVVRTWTEWDWEGAGASFQRAIELNPNYGAARCSYSYYLLIMRRWDEALVEVNRALELDPMNAKFQGFHAVVLRRMGRYDESIDVYRNILRTVPNHPMVISGLASVFYEKGMYEEAFEQELIQASMRGGPEGVKALKQGHAEGGFKGAMNRQAELREALTLAGTGHPSPEGTASRYAKAGNNEKAIEWLERAFEERDPSIPHIGLAIEYDGLRDYPRYQNLIRRLNFPEDVIARILKEHR